MNFFPGIHESKKVKKITSFCNPLTGSFYSNKDFLRNCKNVPRSISELDHIKQITYETNNEENLQKSGKNAGKSTAYTSKLIRKKMQREMIAVHVTNRLAEPVKKSFNESAIMKRKQKKASEIEKSQEIQRANYTKSSLSTTYKDEGQSFSYLSRQDKATNVNNPIIHGSVNFHDIEILVLDLLFQQEDFLSKTIRINLQKYFRSFFKKQLTGHLTQQFLDKVEYYISELLQRQKIDQPIDQSQYPVEFFTISSRIIFMNKLLEFEAKKTLMNQENIRILIRFYCVPSKSFRQSCLRDIILMLTLQIYEKFNCSRENQYILLDQNGSQIQQILQIKFSTKKLFLTSKKHSTKNFNNYLVLLDEFYQQGKKLTFTENIKLNFRNKLAQGQYDQTHFNYSENHQLYKLKRLVELQNAQNMLKKRAETHRVCKFMPKQQQSSLTQQSFKKTFNQGFSIQDYHNQSHPLNQLTEKSNLKDQNIWKLSQKRLSPEITTKKNLSPQKTISPLRIRSSLKNQTQIQKEKLQSLLKGHKKNGLNEEVQRIFLNEFQDLVSKNDIVDFKFNHHFNDRVLKQVLKSYFVYFKDKTDDQINKIIHSLKHISNSNKVNANQKNPSMQSIGKAQISELESSNKNQKLEASQREKYIGQSLTWQEFKNLKTIAGCSEPKEPLMSFVAKYFNFNQFGELSKEGLLKEIKFILQEKCDQASEEVIVDVIWSWFESNSIIENGFIRRMTLESWYEKYKIVYFMLVSLIFGSNHKTVLDLAYQVLA